MVCWKAPGSILEALGLDFGGSGDDVFDISHIFEFFLQEILPVIHKTAKNAKKC